MNQGCPNLLLTRPQMRPSDGFAGHRLNKKKYCNSEMADRSPLLWQSSIYARIIYILRVSILSMNVNFETVSVEVDRIYG